MYVLEIVCLIDVICEYDISTCDGWYLIDISDLFNWTFYNLAIYYPLLKLTPKESKPYYQADPEDLPRDQNVSH